MTFKNSAAVGFAALLLAASTSFAMAQATGKENNATSGSSAGAGPASGPEVKGSTSDTKPNGDTGSMKSDSGSMKNEQPTSAGTKDEQSKDLRGHSETPK